VWVEGTLVLLRWKSISERKELNGLPGKGIEARGLLLAYDIMIIATSYSHTYSIDINTTI
jgi:hypothetical protein